MKILEQLCQGKKSPEANEDRIVTTPYAAAVIDGVTASSADKLLEGKTVGQYAADQIAEAVQTLGPDEDCRAFMSRATAALAQTRQKHNLPRTARLSAAAIIYNVHRNEVWRVGDSHVGFVLADGTWQPHPGGKLFDQINSRFMAQLMELELDHLRLVEAREPTLADMAAIRQVAWQALDVVLRKQLMVANNANSPYGFSVLDGTPIPTGMLEIIPVPKDTKTIVLCSDGCPIPRPAWAQVQADLELLRTQDPLCLGRNPLGIIGGKGFVTPQGTLDTFMDDISYLSLRP